MNHPDHPARRLMQNLFDLVESSIAVPTEHPTDEQWAQFMAGDPALSSDESLFAHLAVCGECRDVLGAMSTLERRRNRGLARGRAALGGRQWRRAEGVFRRVTELFPDELAAWLGLGQARAGGGRFDGAAEAYRRCLQMDAQNLQARVGLAQSLDESGRSAEAAALWRELLAERRADIQFESFPQPDLKPKEDR